MRGADIVRIARQRAGLTQQQLADRTGHPRVTIARWETGQREPTLASLESLVAACGLELVVSLANRDDSLDELVADQLAHDPRDRLTRLLPEAEADRTVEVLRRLVRLRSPFLVVGGVGAALQGAPQRPADGTPEVVVPDEVVFLDALREDGFAPEDDDARFADEDRRWRWARNEGTAVRLASALPGSSDYRDLRRAAERLTLRGVGEVAVAHPRDLLRLAEASALEAERARVPGLRALLRVRTGSSA